MVVAAQSPKIKLVEVIRDRYQGAALNKPSCDPRVIESVAIWNDMAVRRNDSSPDAIGVIYATEFGGADFQVQEVNLNEDSTEHVREVTEAAPNIYKRILFRAMNGLGLSENSVSAVKHLVKQNIIDTLGLLLNKSFDSQCEAKKNIASARATKDAIDKGSPAKFGLTISYANGEDCDPLRPGFNPYPDEFYIKVLKEHIDMAKSEGLTGENCFVDFKDMIGGMDAETAKRLLPKIIEILRENEFGDADLELHLHDTGLALDTCVAAAQVCEKYDQTLVLDIAVGEDTGFVCPLKLEQALLKVGINLGFTKQDRDDFKRKQDLDAEIVRDYAIAFDDNKYDGKYFRKYHIPGGGGKAFREGIEQANLVEKLNISDDEAFHVAGHGLMQVARLLGYPLPVTPGFAMKQLGAIDNVLLDSMIDAGDLHKEMTVEDMQKSVLRLLSEEEVKKYLLDCMPPKLAEFIRNNKMPTEHGLAGVEHSISPCVRAAHPLNEEPVFPDDVDLDVIKTEIAQLQREGIVKPTITQARRILKEMEQDGQVLEGKVENIIQELQERSVIYERPDGQKSDWYEGLSNAVKALAENDFIVTSATSLLFQALDRAAHSSSTARQIVLGPEKLREKNSHPSVNKDPKHTSFHANEAGEITAEVREEYDRHKSELGKGLSAQPDRDAVSILRQHFMAASISPNDVDHALKALREQEWHQVHASVIKWMQENPESLYAAVETQILGGDGAVRNAIDEVKALQQKAIDQKKQDDRSIYLHSDDAMKSIAAGFLRQQIDDLVGQIQEAAVPPSLTAIDVLKQSELQEVSNDFIMEMPGSIIEVSVEEGDYVTEDDEIFVLEAMKMKYSINAGRSGKIANINVSVGDSVTGGDILMSFEPAERESTLIERHIAALDEDNKSALGEAAQSVEAALPTENIGYGPDIKPELPSVRDENGPIYIVMNRAGCAQIISDAHREQGCDVRILYTNEDKGTPVVKNARPEEKIRVRKYNDQDEILGLVRNIAEENQGRQIQLLPGWSFFSEEPEFVERVEQMKSNEDIDVLFLGPPSRPMRAAGNKNQSRVIAEESAPGLNPPFFMWEGNTEQLQDFVEGGCQETHAQYSYYKSVYDQIADELHGAAAFKAVSGGGGKGIEKFFVDQSLGYSENLEACMKLMLTNCEYVDAEAWKDKSIQIERWVHNAHHFEVQMVAAGGEACLLPPRNCTLQQKNQKIVETNIIEGDYDPQLFAKAHHYGQLFADKLASKGYKGVGTIEMLLVPGTKEICVEIGKESYELNMDTIDEVGDAFLLEVNTRLQVEHPVTQGDLALKGIDISFPWLQTLCCNNPDDKTVWEILEENFNLTKDQLEDALLPGKERYMEVRLTAKLVDLLYGNENCPTDFKDYMCRQRHFKTIEEECGVKIIYGGKGTGATDAQFGALLGTRENVEKALEQLALIFSVSEQFEHAARSTTNVPFVQWVLKSGILFNEDGTFNHKLKVDTFDQMLEKIRKGEVNGSEIEVPHDFEKSSAGCTRTHHSNENFLHHASWTPEAVA